MKRINGIVKEQGIEPSALALEITENIFMGTEAGSREVLRNIKDMGVKIAIDDFGTGYSNLNYLRNYSVDELKIDQSFVRDITSDASDAAISSAIVALSKELGLSVIAEGVETEAQADFLRSKGCDQFQGYLYSRPLPFDDFADRFLWGRG